MTFQPYHYCTLVTQHSQGEREGESEVGKGEAQLSDRKEEKGEEIEGAEKGKKKGEAGEDREGGRERWREGQRRAPEEQGKRLSEDARGEVAGEEGCGPRRVTEGGSVPQPHSNPTPQPAPMHPTPPLALVHRLWGMARQARSCRNGEEKQSLLGFGERYCFVARTKHSTFQ